MTPLWGKWLREGFVQNWCVSDAHINVIRMHLILVKKRSPLKWKSKLDSDGSECLLYMNLDHLHPLFHFHMMSYHTSLKYSCVYQVVDSCFDILPLSFRWFLHFTGTKTGEAHFAMLSSHFQCHVPDPAPPDLPTNMTKFHEAIKFSTIYSIFNYHSKWAGTRTKKRTKFPKDDI